MKILKEILDSLPPSPIVEEAYVCAFDIAVRSARWGLSSTFRDPCACTPAWLTPPEGLLGRPARDVARYALSDRLLEASMGMAAVNSLLDPGELVLHKANAARIIEEKGRGKNVVIVGCFPFLDSVRSAAKSLRVVNRKPWEGREGIEEARAFLPGADVAAISGSAFINHTIDDLLALCPGAYTLILGPTTPLSPVLFRHGVDAICGTTVVDPARALPSILQGAPYRLIGGVDRVTAFQVDGGGR